MTHGTAVSQEYQIDDFVKAYESARLRDGAADLAEFLPEAGHPLYLPVLCELVRADLEFAWEHGQPRCAEDYRAQFPELFRDAVSLQAIAFEEYRLRQQAGEQPTPEEYGHRFGVDTADWPRPAEDAEKQRRRTFERTAVMALPPGSAVEQAAQGYRRFQREHAADKVVPLLGAWGSVAPAQVFEELHRSDPDAASRLAEAVTTLPPVGSTFLNFRLLAELGRGAFGRVYLAQQDELARRYVVLKVSTDLLGESQVLAQLQHTNIVPIYSIHHVEPFQAVCMPFLGATTLRDVLQDLGTRQSLPASGKGLVSTLHGRKSATYRGSSLKLTGSKPGDPASAVSLSRVVEAGDLPQPHNSTETLKKLEGYTYINAVLWMASRLADGLGHAHERGILHRDLKPANVLLTDEGQPMLLDFNLSEDTKLRASASAALIGGTLPYMAPEHLEAFQGEPSKVDARSDLYSLGIILFELLTGRHPFEMPPKITKDTLGDMVRMRRQAPPRLRPLNRDLSPAVESIVRHCLEPDPARRYQSARELQEDLERHLGHLPLKHAPEASLRERAGKWQRRHPRALWAALCGLAAVSLLVLGVALASQRQRLARVEASGAFRQTREDVSTAQVLLTGGQMDGRQRQEGKALSQEILERYQIVNDPAWQERDAVRLLAGPDREELRRCLGDLLLLLAADADLELHRADAAPPEERVRSALRLNELARVCYAGGPVPSLLRHQEASLQHLLGPRDQTRLEEKTRVPDPQTSHDRCLLGAHQVRLGRFREALPLLREAARQDPQDFNAWFGLGNCYDGVAKELEAVACYNACLALQPGSPWPYFYRGSAYLRLKEHDEAIADLTRALELRPTLSEAYINRSLAQLGRKEYRAALEDVTHALDLGTPHTRAYFIRSRIRLEVGDREGARKDRELGLREEPADEKSWIARGLARVSVGPDAALADLDAALKLNPRSFDALQNKAHVLGELMGRTNDAVAVLDRAVELYPDAALPRGGRGVLLARLGNYPAARRDGADALLRDTRPAILYQVAGIYALTSRDNQEDRREALRLLSSALQKGFGLDVIDRDPDLDPLRKDPEFQRVVNAARALHPTPGARVPRP